MGLEEKVYDAQKALATEVLDQQSFRLWIDGFLENATVGHTQEETG